MENKDFNRTYFQLHWTNAVWYVLSDQRQKILIRIFFKGKEYKYNTSMSIF